MCTDRVLVLMGIASVLLALALRFQHRGSYFPGWDVLPASQGLHLLSTQTFQSFPGWDGLSASQGYHLVSTQTFHQLLQFYSIYHEDKYLMGWLYGVHSVLMPGWLASMWPWEFWPHAITLACTLLMFGLVASAVSLKRREMGIVFLAWGASPPLLSFSVTGMPYILNFLPYAAAIWTVLRLQRHWLLSLLCCAVVMELSWHVQELGRTVFVVFLAAAVLLPGATRATRMVWLLAFALQFWHSAVCQSFNTEYYAGMTLPGLDQIAPRLRALAVRIISEPFIDLPLLLGTGVMSVLLVGWRKGYWGALMAFHVGLLVWLGINAGTLRGPACIWPRRILLLDCLCLTSVVACYQSGRGRPLLVGLLLLGNCWQLADTIRWSRDPLPVAGQTAWPHVRPYQNHPLPFTHTTLDYLVQFDMVDWAKTVRAEVEAGKQVILLYNLASDGENGRDPAGVLERLYLGLGHARFMRSVLVFGSQTTRWTTFPVRPLSEIASAVRDLGDPARVIGYLVTSPADTPLAAKEAEQVLEALAQRFGIVWERPLKNVAPYRRIVPFRLRERTDGSKPLSSPSGMGSVQTVRLKTG